MRWIWPLSWYFEIRELRAKVAALESQKRKLDAMMRAEAISHTSMMAAYVASLSSIAGMVPRR